MSFNGWFIQWFIPRLVKNPLGAFWGPRHHLRPELGNGINISHYILLIYIYTYNMYIMCIHMCIYIYIYIYVYIYISCMCICVYTHGFPCWMYTSFWFWWPIVLSSTSTPHHGLGCPNIQRAPRTVQHRLLCAETRRSEVPDLVALLQRRNRSTKIANWKITEFDR